MKKKCLALGFLTTIFLAEFFNLPPVLAVATDSVTATIKISVCGNETVESGEDCEGEDLNDQTCVGLGYAGGTLVCDIACSFDTSDCTVSTPTPTPTSTPTPTVTPTATPTQTPTPGPTSTPTPAPAATSTPAPGATATPTFVPIPAPVIPAVVAVFDLDGSGRIETPEVFAVVKSWVEEWTEAIKEELMAAQTGEPAEVAPGVSPAPTARPRKCDLNADRRCDLFDLSILLYYIGK